MNSAVHLIAKLWPFMSHSIRSVRRAALRTMSVLLATESLNVGEPVVTCTLIYIGIVFTLRTKLCSVL